MFFTFNIIFIIFKVFLSGVTGYIGIEIPNNKDNNNSNNDLYFMKLIQ